MHSSVSFSMILLCTLRVIAHMQLVSPAPFNATNNPHRITAADPYLQYPYDCCGPDNRWMYPCRGYLNLLNTPQGAPTADWAVGSDQTWNISGIGNHWGGSCQVGFSIDQGQTFHVAMSYEGNCPHRHGGDGPAGQDFRFTVPSDLPTGIQVFAWIWYNREQEFNMNCAAVNISSPGNSNRTSPTHAFKPTNMEVSMVPPPASIVGAPSSTSFVRFDQRPLMLIADDGNGCLTPKTTAEVKYPHPGPDVTLGDGVYPLGLPVGNCAAPEMFANQGYQDSNGNEGHE